ncbi:MAG: hypothetical protein ACI90V_003616 [Bacillariaceae sp.]|jgi:hypothetical protein
MYVYTVWRYDPNVRGKNNYYLGLYSRKRNPKIIISNIPVGRSSKEAFAELFFCIFIPSLDKLAVGIPRSVLPLPKPLTTTEVSRRGKLPSTNCSSSTTSFVVVMTDMMAHYSRFYDPSFPVFANRSFAVNSILNIILSFLISRKISS